ncbi:MAG: 23S rRNA pseudouridine(1911/1915/1917) synthase RluD [Gammaproteobacteria bacterium]|jgi:23S rRNA pseudouridine1911/1915/1917 synthase
MAIVQLIELSGTIPLNAKDKRLDQALAILFPEYSRENLKQWIIKGDCQVNNKILSPKIKVKGGEIVNISTKLTIQNQNWQPENLPLNIIYEDQDILILNKPSNIIMHPAAGNWQGTILNALLNYNTELNLLPRAGIIHRLDQDTTGLVIVAKNLLSYNQLILQQKNHEITKIYEAVVFGTLIAGGTINAPIGRHPRNRLKMDVIDNGKPAITHYRILKKFKNHTHIKLQLETGRTHQIRVHMQHINHPIVGDRLYSKFSSTFPRQALHAKELSFKHPITNQDLCFTTSLPLDLQNLLTKL